VVTSTIVEPSDLDLAVRRYAALADATRLRILATLLDREACACVVQTAVDVAPNLLSYHLRVLREAGLIDGTRRGRWIDYRVARGATEFVADALAAAGIRSAAGRARRARPRTSRAVRRAGGPDR
jgi:ArsR family transcriptional regulator